MFNSEHKVHLLTLLSYLILKGQKMSPINTRAFTSIVLFNSISNYSIQSRFDPDMIEKNTK